MGGGPRRGGAWSRGARRGPRPRREAQDVGETLLLDNDRVTVYEFLFPPGFRGEEHAAAANEFAYVLDGEFVVVTKGQGTRTVKRGEVEYAAKGTIHASLNETSRPARVLVVMLKGH